MQILVLGMHRSGTSMVARLLNMMGAYFAPDGTSLGANQENQKGFWERRDVLNLNDMLLHSAGADWHRLSDFTLEKIPAATLAQFNIEAGKIVLAMDAHRPWFLKEPRFCLLTPLWLDLLEVPVCVIVNRSPIEVARSLEMRNGFPIAVGLALWECYNVAALNATRGRRRIQVNHADLMADPVGAVRQLQKNLEALNVRGLRAPSDEEILAFVDPLLYRAKQEQFRGRLSPAQRRLWRAFQKGRVLLGKKALRFSAESQEVLSQHHRWLEAQDKLAELSAEKERLQQQTEKLLSDLRTSIAKAEDQRKALEEKLNTQLATIQQRDDRIAELQGQRKALEEKLNTQLATIQQRDDRIAELQDQRKAVEEKLNAQLAASIAKAEDQRKGAEDQRKGLEEKLNTQLVTIQERDQQIMALQEKAAAQAASLCELERATLKYVTKLGKWSERLLQEYKRVLNSNRWRIGCWLSLKRADDKSKEAQRLAQLVASRPEPASGGQSSTGKGKPDRTAGALPDLDNRDAVPATAAAGSSVAATPEQHVTKNPLNPLLDRGVRPGAVPKAVGGGGQSISIVIPVYNAYDDLIRCLESVQSHSRPEYPVIVIDDASPDERIWPLLQEWATQHQNFRVVRNDSNLGYTATVNRGCELAGPGDIILLNSDTIVSPHWIEQMSACAYSRPRVATVTAVSNAAGAFSVPRKNAINELPPGWSVDQMAAFIQRTSQRIRPIVPTGHGFCMYITNAARTAIGSFDAERFPGYGEENDYCLRASATGFVNLIDDATYIFHRQSASFGAAKEEILKRSRATLDRLYPEYMPLICYWNQVDALNPVREKMQRQLDVALTSGLETILPNEQKPCLLFVVHDGGGGVEIMTEDLSLEMASFYHTMVLRTALGHWTLHEYFGGDLVFVRRYSFAEPWRVDRPMTSDRLAVITEICADYKVDLAHVHHLLANGPELLTLLRQLEIPIVFSLHDFYTICPTIQLLDETQTFCAGQCTAGAGDCPLVPNWFRPPLPPLKHRYVHQHRSRMSAALQLVDACVTNSEASRSLIAQHFPALADGRFTVIEYGRDLLRLNLAQPAAAGNPLRAVCFGALGPHKGTDLLRQLLEKNLAAGNPLEIHVLGQKSAKFDPESLGAIYHGPYRRDELAEPIRAIGPAVSLIPSLWPETYCYVLTESWAMGLPVLASDIGTLRERVLKHGGGWLLPVGDAEQWFAKMLTLRNDHQGYAAALAEIQKMQFLDRAWMAGKYDAIYKKLLAGRQFASGSKSKEARRLTQLSESRPEPTASTNEYRAASKDTGCGLNFKRAGEKSKEAQRLAQLIASRPRLVSGGRDISPVKSSTGKGEPDGTAGALPDLDNRDAVPATAAAGSSVAATPEQHVTKNPLNPLLDRGVRPGAVPKAVGGGGQSISIVIPVYNAYDDLIRCLESVQSHSRPEYPVIVIDDASPDERIWPLLQEWATQHQNFRVVRNDSNLGYTATVNRGCELAGPGDIILLNSDTIVSPHWIEQMSACAYSRPRVATVTAVSNAAGAFSVPRKNAINELPPGWSVDQMAAFIQRTSQRIRPIVPTGHGFCMYITNAARTAIGSFDAERFPGYGEENDYCLRASATGFVNLIDDATYIFHRQSASFGAAKEEILKRS